MEAYSAEEVKILYRFSNAQWVLSFYGNFFESWTLMTSLWKATNKCWNQYYEAFCNALEYIRKQLTYTKSFDLKLGNFLLDHSRYKKYELTVNLNSKESMEEFMSFLSGIKSLWMFRFSSIICLIEKESVETYNELCRMFINSPHLDVRWIFSRGTSLRTPSGLMKISSWSTLVDLSAAKSAQPANAEVCTRCRTIMCLTQKS